MRVRPLPTLVPVLAVLAAAGCNDGVEGADVTLPGGVAGVSEGQALFRHGTFGTEGYWSDAVGLGRGLAALPFTLRDALALGLQIDGANLAVTEGSEPTLDPALLDDPELFKNLLARGDVVGLVPRDADDDGILDLAGADTLGISCALCHSIVDGSLHSDPVTGGAVGARIDGPAPALIDLAGLFALADTSRALYPFLPQSHETIGGFPIARTGGFVRADSSEEAVDALLRDRDAFPLGQWDTVPDGIGAPTVPPGLYDLRGAAPYFYGATYADPLDALNAHITYGLDPTSILSVPGGVFLDRIALGIGAELTEELRLALDLAGVETPMGGFPYVDALATGVGAVAASPTGYRVSARELGALGMYLGTLLPPAAPVGDPVPRARGEVLYATICAECHGVPSIAQRGLAPTSLNQLLVQYAPTQLLARGFPYSAALDDVLLDYDNRLVLFDRLFTEIQVPLDPRSIATPRLLDLHRRTSLLHDGSVQGLGALLDPARGAGAPHPYYVSEPARSDLIEFLTTR